MRITKIKKGYMKYTRKARTCKQSAVDAFNGLSHLAVIPQVSCFVLKQTNELDYAQILVDDVILVSGCCGICSSVSRGSSDGAERGIGVCGSDAAVRFLWFRFANLSVKVSERIGFALFFVLLFDSHSAHGLCVDGLVYLSRTQTGLFDLDWADFVVHLGVDRIWAMGADTGQGFRRAGRNGTGWLERENARWVHVQSFAWLQSHRGLNAVCRVSILSIGLSPRGAVMHGYEWEGHESDGRLAALL